MGINCTCPCCRHGRGELTEYEYGWYLRGCIETAAMIPQSVIDYCKDTSRSTKEEQDFEMDLWTDDSGNRILLKEIAVQCRKNKLEVPEAFEKPDEPIKITVFNGMTQRERGWYLKGCIEMATFIPDVILDRCKLESSSSEERDFAGKLLGKLASVRFQLKNLVAEITEHPEPAFLHPEEYTLPKENFNVKTGC